jgi:hypothetical protein
MDKTRLASDVGKFLLSHIVGREILFADLIRVGRLTLEDFEKKAQAYISKHI